MGANSLEPSPDTTRAIQADVVNGGESSDVSRLFEGRSVFVTGASGFIGRVLVEKLLRTYPAIRNIYVLLRKKKGLEPSERLHKHILNAPIFERLRKSKDGQAALDKVVAVSGDISEPELGLSPEDLGRLLDDEHLSIIFHSAATIKFDEPLKTSIKLNLIATRDVLALARRLKNLVSFCHVSTAYVNSDIRDESVIEEQIYPVAGMRSADLIHIAQRMDAETMQMLKAHLVGPRPNTYTYTKALSEQMLREEAGDLPLAIVRPSIVVASWREPLPGWVDNLNGPTGLVLAIGKGLLRSLHVKRASKADIVPVDICVNTMIAAAHHVAVTRGKLCGRGAELAQSAAVPIEEQHPNGEPSEPFVVHCNSGQLNPITWGDMEDLFLPVIRRYPSCQVFRYANGSFKSNKYHDFIVRLFVHYLPALVIDLVCAVSGKKRQLMSIYCKLHGAVGALTHFTTQNYNFHTGNLRLLRSSLRGRDKRDLFMDIERVKWLDYWEDYVIGARRYVLKESDDTLALARKSFKRAWLIELTLRLVLGLALLGWLAGPALDAAQTAMVWLTAD